MELSSLFLPFVLLLTTLIIISVLKAVIALYNLYFYWTNKGIPYLPQTFFMNWKVFLGRMSLAAYEQYIYDSFSDAKYIGIMDFATPAVFLRDPELIKDIAVKDFGHFTDRRSLIDEDAHLLFGKNLFSLRGDRWRKMRHVLSPTFTANKMKFMFDLISKCSRNFVDYLIDHPELCSEIETKHYFRRYAVDVIATSSFGISVNSMKDPDNEFYTRGLEASKISGGFLTLLRFMLLRLSPRLCKLLGLNFFPPGTSEFFKKIVEETITAREEQDIVRSDMIHLLMQARDKEDPSAQGSSPSKLTLDDIVSQAFTFFLGGFDTSSTFMCFVIHELAINQTIQDRLRKEVLRHAAEENDEISYDSLLKMTYMDMVISEALRKYPTMVLFDRTCNKSYKLPPSQTDCKSFIIEPNVSIFIPVFSLHRDPKYFPNPEKFDPERFSYENKDKIISYAYLPFGLGPRKCIGDRFALMETKLLVANLLQKFIIKPTEKTVEPIIFDKKQFTLKSVDGYWIRLEKREM